MLPKSHRLARPADFKRVYARGRSWAYRVLVLYRAPNELPVSRFGISVSRRIGSAVVRNRTKRRLREVLRPLCEKVTPGYDVILIARHGIVDAEHAVVEQSVRQLLLQAGMLCE